MFVSVVSEQQATELSEADPMSEVKLASVLESAYTHLKC